MRAGGDSLVAQANVVMRLLALACCQAIRELVESARQVLVASASPLNKAWMVNKSKILEPRPSISSRI